jgi:F420-0:gamma-glutamyl ligase
VSNKKQKTMFDKIKKTIADQASQIKENAIEQATQLKVATIEQATHFSDAAIEKAKETSTQLSVAVKEKANSVTDAIKDKTFGLVEDWLKIFPSLENHGFIITSFGISMSISPILEVELCGEAEDFSVEKLDTILEEVKGNNALTTVFKTVRMTYDWHKKTGGDCYFDKVYIKLTVGISPQVMVYLGEPKLM